MFLVKYNSSGEKQWGQQLGGGYFSSGGFNPYGNDGGEGVTVDSSNNIYVAGYFSKSLDGHTNSGGAEIFLAKYNSSGVKQWTKPLGTSGWDLGRGVTADSSNNIYVTGTTSGGLDGNTNSGGTDIFLAKFDSAGTFYASSAGDNSTATYESVVTLHNLDNDTDVTVAVSSSDTGEATVSPATLTFTENNWSTAQTVTVTGVDDNNSDGHQEYEVGLSAELPFHWSGTQQLGTSSGDTKTDGVTVDSSGNIYVTGYTYGGLDNNTNSGNTDIFLVKYNSSGVKQWTKQLGTSQKDEGRGVTVDSSDNIYVTGSTRGGLDDNTNMSGTSWDIFLVKYNSSGVKQIGRAHV